MKTKSLKNKNIDLRENQMLLILAEVRAKHDMAETYIIEIGVALDSAERCLEHISYELEQLRRIKAHHEKMKSIRKSKKLV